MTRTLLQLPAEIVLHILSYLGFDFFAQDVRLLSVSKAWYALAWPVFVREVRFTETTLVKAMDGGATTSLNRIRLELNTVKLVFQGHDVPADQLELMAVAGNAGEVDDVAYRLRPHLFKLCPLLMCSAGLRSLVITTKGLQRRGFQITKPLTSLLHNLWRLTSLEIDIVGWNMGQPWESDMHLCRSVNVQLPSLRRLRCRMDTVCDSLLDPSGFWQSSLDLEEVIVNLSLLELSEAITSYHYPARCNSISQTGVLQLREAMETTAAALSLRLRRPRMVRVIYHEFPSLETRAFDALTGKRIRLRNSLEWDAEGEVLGEAETDDSEDDESDLSDDDSPAAPEIVL